MKKGKLIICLVLSGLLLLSFSTVCLAGDETVETPELTLQQAVDRALELSKSLKSAEIEKKKAKEQREDAQDAVKYTPIGMINDQIAAAYSNLMLRELNYQIKSKDLESLKDDIKTQVLEKYCAVLSAEKAEAAAKQALKDAEWQYTAAMAKLRVGMLPPASQVAVDAALKSAKANLSSAQENLNKAYVELNSLVGFLPETRMKLTTDIPYKEFVTEAINAEVNRAIANNTDVWKALQNVIIERQHLRMTENPAAGIDSYEIEKMEIEVAELTAAEAKDALEEALVLLYHDILTLQENISASEQGVAAAEQALATAKLQFEVGMATQGDVISAETKLETAKSTLAGLRYKHATALAGYRNLTGREVLPAVAQDNQEDNLL